MSRNRSTKVCSIPGCGKRHFGHGYCRKHHAAIVTRGGYVVGPYPWPKKECKLEGCSEPAGHNSVASGYCTFHYRRFIAGVPLDLPYYCNRGDRNGMWKGGTSEYPNHYLLKQNRLIVLAKSNYKCKTCGKKCKMVSHKDKDKSNHATTNLEPICDKCKGKKFGGRHKLLKFLGEGI